MEEDRSHSKLRVKLSDCLLCASHSSANGATYGSTGAIFDRFSIGFLLIFSCFRLFCVGFATDLRQVLVLF